MTGHPATRPYLIRAIHEWAVDNNLTPHILVDATVVGVKAPPGYARGGQITFNIHPQAVKDLSLGNEWLLFSARFGGNSFSVEIPAKAVLAIYARETGRGIFFQGEDGETANGPSLARGPRLGPIGETANGPSLARGPRLDPIGETTNGPSLARGPRLGPIGETTNGPSLARGPRLDPIGETADRPSLARGPRTRVPGVPPITSPIGETAAGRPLSATDGDEPPPPPAKPPSQKRARLKVVK